MAGTNPFLPSVPPTAEQIKAQKLAAFTSKCRRSAIIARPSENN